MALTRNVRVEGGAYTLDGVDRVTGLLLPERHRLQGYLKAEYGNARMGAVANLSGTFFSMASQPGGWDQWHRLSDLRSVCIEETAERSSSFRRHR